MTTESTYPLRCDYRHQLADTVTPVSIYLRLRDQFSHCFLLESTDYRPNGKSLSYVCCDPIAEFRVQHGTVFESFPDGRSQSAPIDERGLVSEKLQAFVERFKVESESEQPDIANGLFGYVAFDCIRFFEELDIQDDPDESRDIPDIQYFVFRYIIAIDHAKNTMILQENQWGEQGESELDALAYQIVNKDFPVYPFFGSEETESNFTDEEYTEVIAKCQWHIRRGDVFQMVPSRRYSTRFSGDEFNVYRMLRSINPSPYLFYFDFGNFKIFGSSPEAQLIVRDGEARLFPIAGTYKRTGDNKVDQEAIEKLIKDPKENAEHVMLVDLARNDLSKHCEGVEVEEYKEIQMYSHVIHLTSRVVGHLREGANAVHLLGDTFPMGTLSGAPKYRALELINEFERGRRRAYGGAIGNLGFDGSCNHAIVIRSFLSKANTLHYQAGGGIVADSNPASELQEINNKLGALNAALLKAGDIQ